MPNLVIKAFNKDYQLIDYAIYEGDFTVQIPEDCVLKKIKKSKKEKTTTSLKKSVKK